jgi:tetratricopeptide (TPR) repeat protein
MPMVELEAEALRRELERVLGSPGFARNDRLSRFLRFVVERHTEGRDHELKESVVGVEVFGRKPDYNPKFDPIVRTEARRLRARLNEYYQGAGASDSMVIELPKGGYVPLLRQHPAVAGEAERRTGLSLAVKPRFVLAAACLTAAVAIVGSTWFAPGGRTKSGTNSEAYNLYLRARGFEMQPSLQGAEQSIDLFEHAIAKDPSFAPAYAGIAAGYAARSAFDRFDPAERADMIAKGWAAAARAMGLDPQLADAQAALGMMQARRAQWEPAERSFRRAIELAPSDLLWRNHFAMFLLLPLGRIEEALRQLRVAEDLDPLSPQTHNALSLALGAAGRFDEADFHCQKAAEDDRQRSRCWASALLRQGEGEQAIRILEATWSGHLLEPGAQALGIAYAKVGRRQDGERIAAIVPRLASKAQIFAALGDKDRTLAVLDQMVPMGPTRIGRDFLIASNFWFLRGDPRLKELRKKVGLPE